MNLVARPIGWKFGRGARRQMRNAWRVVTLMRAADQDLLIAESYDGFRAGGKQRDNSHGLVSREFFFLSRLYEIGVERKQGDGKEQISKDCPLKERDR